MASIPLPALGVQPPQVQNPIQGYRDFMAIKSAQQNQQLQQQQMAANQQEQQIRAQQIADQQARTAAMKDADPTSPTYFEDMAKGVLKYGGSADAAQQEAQRGLGIKKAISDIAATDATTGSKNLQTFIDAHKAVGDALEGLVDPKTTPDDQLHAAATQTVNDLTKNKILDPGSAQRAMQIIQSTPDPAALRTAIDGVAKTSMGAKAVAEQQQAQQALKESTAKTGEAEATTAEKQATAQWYKDHPGTGAPGVPAEIVQQSDWLKNNPGKGPSDFLAWKAKQAPLATFNLQSGLLTDQAKDMAAENYFQTGQLPAGARSPAMIAQIIDRAGQLHPGGSLAGNKAAYDANKKSYDNVTGTLDTLTAFENTGLKNLKQFTDLAEKIPDTGVPWLNTPVRLLNRNLVGDANMAAVEAARSVALREIARVTNDPKLSGQLTDNARGEVSGFSPQNATLPQIKAVAQVLQQDMANVHQSLAAQKADIGKRLGIAEQPAATTTQSGGGGGAKVGDLIVQNNKTFKVTKVDANGKPVAAVPQ
jgi:hypothetical protein